MNKKNKYILHIINKLNNNISIDQQQELTTWLEADEKHQAEYERIAKIVAQGKKMEFPADPDVEAEWNSFEFPAEPEAKPGLISELRHRLSEVMASILRPRRLVYATVLVIILVMTALWYKQYLNIMETIATGNRQQSEITLSDGTHVWLNCGTSVTYPRNFSNRARSIELSGEAFFNVAKSKIPFVVQTTEGKITVLGTRFNVWARARETRVIVEEGRVRLSPANDSLNSVLLSKNQMSYLFKVGAPVEPQPVEANARLGWRHGRLVFERTKLAELARELERYYDVGILIENPELQSRSVTAAFERLPLEKVLYSIGNILDIHYKYENGLYVFYENNNKK